MQDSEAVFIVSLWQGPPPKSTDEIAYCATPTCGAKLSKYNLDCKPFCASCYNRYNNEMIQTITYYREETGATWRKAVKQAENQLRPDWFPTGGPWTRT